jgi:hypothetical protein
MTPHQYDTVQQAVRGLAQRGYTADFGVADQRYLHSPGLELRLHPEEFHVREVYRFEGPSDPGDENVVYAIESDAGVRGVLVSAFGPYSEPWADELMHKLSLPHA